MVLLGIAGWLATGLIVGFIASKLVKLRGDDPKLGIVVAAAGGIVCAVIYTIVSGAGISGWNPRSIMFTAVGAVVAVAIWHVVRAKYASQELYVPRRSN